jgi:hypothetical protein
VGNRSLAEEWGEGRDKLKTGEGGNKDFSSKVSWWYTGLLCGAGLAFIAMLGIMTLIRE